MSSEIKFKEHNSPEENLNYSKKVNVTNLVSRLNEERKKERETAKKESEEKSDS